MICTIFKTILPAILVVSFLTFPTIAFCLRTENELEVDSPAANYRCDNKDMLKWNCEKFKESILYPENHIGLITCNT